MNNPRQNSTKLTPYAKAMRKQPSDGERKLWQALRNRQLEGLKFRRQQPVGPFIADFACDACRLIVEIDGEQHGDAEAYDASRTAKLIELGWRVIRFSSSEAVRDTDAVLATILREAKAAG